MELNALIRLSLLSKFTTHEELLYLLTLTIISASCAKVEKTFTWTGEREVGAEGGTVVWTPNV